MQRRGGYIAIEGPIGVGKTSLARALAKELNARLVLEGVDPDVQVGPALGRRREEVAGPHGLGSHVGAGQRDRRAVPGCPHTVSRRPGRQHQK